MPKFMSQVALAALFMFLAASCGDSPTPGGGHESEAEAESEGEGDQSCPPEGCATQMPCADDQSCPADEPCRDYFCDDREGYCRYRPTDQDHDGYVRASCETSPGVHGTDCDDRTVEECARLVPIERAVACGDRIHPGAVEQCNGVDDNCNDQVDEDIAARVCGPVTDVPACRLGTRLCQNGAWSECNWTFPPRSEACAGRGSDCQWCAMICDPASPICPPNTACVSAPDSSYGVCLSLDSL